MELFLEALGNRLCRNHIEFLTNIDNRTYYIYFHELNIPKKEREFKGAILLNNVVGVLNTVALFWSVNLVHIKSDKKGVSPISFYHLNNTGHLHHVIGLDLDDFEESHPY